jgi:hypothetical protein
MRKYKVIHLHDGQVIGGKTFNASDTAERYYRELEPGHLGRVELWEYWPPVNVVMGHRLHMGWIKLKEKEGIEEFC